MPNIVAPTYTCIASTTLSTGTAVISFTNIPQNFTDLVAHVTVSNSLANYNTYLFLEGGASIYGRTLMHSDGSTVAVASNNDIVYLADAPNGAPFNGNFETIEYHIFGYNQTNTYKTILSRAGGAGTNSGGRTVIGVGNVRTTNAINLVQFATGGGVLLAGSKFSLYGIKGAM